jgi:class I fructose-bisphosphate aldolase
MSGTTPQVEAILANYAGENPGVIGNLRKMLMTGRLAGTGKLVILPVDQGFEHGPHRSFQPNPPGYDPMYHANLAIDAGCNAYAAPLGSIEVCAHACAGRIPLILKVNNSDTLGGNSGPRSALTSNVEDALRLGCAAIGYTIYPGSNERNGMYQDVRDLIAAARKVGLPTIIWSYPRGGKMSTAGETAIDVCAYAAQIACQLGAHVVKVKPPTSHVEQDACKPIYEKLDMSTLALRVAHVKQAAFAGRRILIFSGGATKGDEEILAEVAELAAGGAFGSIMGRNAFQRPYPDALKLLHNVMNTFAAAAKEGK